MWVSDMIGQVGWGGFEQETLGVTSGPKSRGLECCYVRFVNRKQDFTSG